MFKKAFDYLSLINKAMATDYLVANYSPGNNVSNVDESLLDGYVSVSDSEKQLDRIENMIMEIEPDKIDICDATSLIGQLSDIQSSLTTLSASLVSGVSVSLAPNSQQNGDAINVSSGMENYAATGIIMKKAQLLKMRIQKIKLILERKTVEIYNAILKFFLSGRGSMMTTPIQAPLAVISTIASILNTILSILGTLLSLLQSVVVLNVKDAGCCFFPTPKSLTKQDIRIMNVNQSTTNNIPQPVDETISMTQQSITQSNAVLRNTFVANSAAEGAAAATAGTFTGQLLTSFEKIDYEKIKQLVNVILMTLLDADVLPRYEKLSVTNIRFLTYLATGFEPAAHNCFGFPGFP
jgi:hypothetical protein